MLSGEKKKRIRCVIINRRSAELQPDLTLSREIKTCFKRSAEAESHTQKKNLYFGIKSFHL